MVEHPRTVEQNAVLALAFNELLEAPQPVSVELLAESLGTPVGALEQELAELSERLDPPRRRRRRGRQPWSLDRADPARAQAAARARFTWCAHETLGIFGALAVSGTIRSKTPLEQPVELEIVDGRPVAAVVLFFPQRQVTSVVDEWCPLATPSSTRRPPAPGRPRTRSRGRC